MILGFWKGTSFSFFLLLHQDQTRDCEIRQNNQPYLAWWLVVCFAIPKTKGSKVGEGKEKKKKSDRTKMRWMEYPHFPLQF
jgi:hypothetical protein